MNDSTAQIVTAYEDNGLTPEQIVESFDNEYDLLAVKAVLMQFSAKFRTDNRSGKEEASFSSEDEILARSALKRIVQYSDDDLTVARVSMFIINEKRGRLDKVSNNNNPMVGLLQFQKFLEQANQALARTEEKKLQLTNEKQGALELVAIPTPA